MFVLSRLPAFHSTKSQVYFLSCIKVTSYHIVFLWNLYHFITTQRKVWCGFNLFPVCFQQILFKLHMVKSCIMDTCLTWTPRYYGQFVLPVGNESPYIFSNFNLLIRSLSMAPSVPVLTEFDCLQCIFFSLFMC